MVSKFSVTQLNCNRIYSLSLNLNSGTDSLVQPKSNAIIDSSSVLVR
jgi:hypothetical protein